MAALGFMIVGTPRSGTTLVQRLASELAGVRTPPETHFLDWLARRPAVPFPLAGAELDALLAEFATYHRSAFGLEVDASAMAAAVGSRASTPAELFSGVVESIAGPAELLGEKTPEHLLWWRHMTAAQPALKLVIVVRDPRAVVASGLEADFGMRHPELIAQRWASDQREATAAVRSLGERALVLHYEEVVTDPDATRARLASFLDRPPDRQEIDPASLFLPRESWKNRVTEPVTADRVHTWRDALSPEVAGVVTAVCRKGMRELGYVEATADAGRRRLSPALHARRLAFMVGRRRRLRRIAAYPT